MHRRGKPEKVLVFLISNTHNHQFQWMLAIARPTELNR